MTIDGSFFIRIRVTQKDRIRIRNTDISRTASFREPLAYGTQNT